MEIDSDISDDGSMVSDIGDAFSLDELGSDETGDSSARNSSEESEEEEKLTPEELEKLKEEKRQRKEQLALRKKAELEKMPRTVFVGNLATGVTRSDLVKLFSPFGKVESVRLRGAVPAAGQGRGLKKKAMIQQQFHAQQHNICGFVVFGDATSCAPAIQQLNGRALQGRHLRVDAAASGGANFRARHCIFVGGLPYVAEEEAVRGHFEACGAIVNVRIVRDKCGAPKGIAFVEFEEEAGAVLALKRHGSELCGRTVRVQRWTRPKGEEKGKKRDKGEIGGRGRGSFGGRGRGDFGGRGRGEISGRGRGGFRGRGRGDSSERGRGGFRGRGRGDSSGRGRGGFRGRGREVEGSGGKRGKFEGRGRGRGRGSGSDRRGSKRVNVPSSLHKNERKAFVKRALAKQDKKLKMRRKSKQVESQA